MTRLKMTNAHEGTDHDHGEGEAGRRNRPPPKSSRTFQPRSCFLFGFARDELDDVAIVSRSMYPLSLLQSVLFVGPAFTAPPSGDVRPPLLKPA